MSVNNETARDRLEDVRELEPTSNGELRDRWGMDTTKDVARYLREELAEYTYRDDDSKIRARSDAPVGENDHSAEEHGIDSDPEEDEGEILTEGKDEQETHTAPDDEGVSDPATGTDGDTLEPVEPVEPDAPALEPDTPADPDPAADTSTPSGSDLKPARPENPPCPECGEPTLPGEQIEALLREEAREQEATRRFIDANTGADPERGCRDVYNCGYYVEDGEAKRFKSPGRGVGKKLLTGAGIGVAALAGAAKIANKDRSDTTNIWDGV